MTRPQRIAKLLAPISLGALALGSVHAAEPSVPMSALKKCADIVSIQERVACYDAGCGRAQGNLRALFRRAPRCTARRGSHCESRLDSKQQLGTPHCDDGRRSGVGVRRDRPTVEKRRRGDYQSWDARLLHHDHTHRPHPPVAPPALTRGPSLQMSAPCRAHQKKAGLRPPFKFLEACFRTAPSRAQRRSGPMHRRYRGTYCRCKNFGAP